MKGKLKKKLNTGVCALSLLLSLTPTDLALAREVQHDSHVQLWLQEQAGKQQHDSHVQLWLKEQAGKQQHDSHVQLWLKEKGQTQHDAHVQTWLKEQGEAQQHDAHVQTWLKENKPQHDAHVQVWLNEQAKKPQQDAHVKVWLEEQAKKTAQHDSHVQLWIEEQAKKAVQQDAHVESWRNYNAEAAQLDCANNNSLTLDGTNGNTITLASIASSLVTDCSDYLQSNYTMYCQCQYDKASSKQNAREKISGEDLKNLTNELRWYHKEQVVGEKFDNLMKDYMKLSKSILFALSDPNLSSSVNRSNNSCTPNGIQNFFKSMTSLGPKVCTDDALQRLGTKQRKAHFDKYQNCLKAATGIPDKNKCNQQFGLNEDKLAAYKNEAMMIGPRPQGPKEDYGDKVNKGSLKHYYENYVKTNEEVYNHYYPDKKVNLAGLSFDEMNKELIRIKQELMNDSNVEAISVNRDRKFHDQNLRPNEESFASSLFTAYMLWDQGKTEADKVKFNMALIDVTLVIGSNPLFSDFSASGNGVDFNKLFNHLKKNMDGIKAIKKDMSDSEAMTRSLLAIQEEEIREAEALCNSIRRDMIGVCAAEQNDCVSASDLKIPENMEHIESFLKDKNFKFSNGAENKDILGRLSCVATNGQQEKEGIKRDDFIAAIINGNWKSPNFHTILDQNNACSKEATIEAIHNSGLVDNTYELIGPPMPLMFDKNSAYFRDLEGAYNVLSNSDFSEDTIKNYSSNDKKQGNKAAPKDNITAFSSESSPNIATTGTTKSSTGGSITSTSLMPSRITSLPTTTVATNNQFEIENPESEKMAIRKSSSRRDNQVDEEKSGYLSELEDLRKQKASFDREKETYNKDRIAELERKIEELKSRESTVTKDNIVKTVDKYIPEAKPAPVGGQIASIGSSYTSRGNPSPTPSATTAVTAAADVSNGGSDFGRSVAARTSGSSLDNRGGSSNISGGGSETHAANGSNLGSSAAIVLEARNIGDIRTEDLQKFVTDANKNGTLSVTLADKKTYLIPIKDGNVLINEAQVQVENVAGVQIEETKLDEKQLEEMASLHPELICTLYPSLGREIPEGIKCDNIAK